MIISWGLDWTSSVDSEYEGMSETTVLTEA